MQDRVWDISIREKSGTQLLTDSLNQIFVKDYQSIPVVVNENISVYDAIVTMFLEDVGTLFVVDKDSSISWCSFTKRFTYEQVLENKN